MDKRISRLKLEEDEKVTNREIVLQGTLSLPRLPHEIVEKIFSGQDDQEERKSLSSCYPGATRGWLPYIVDSSSKLLTFSSPEAKLREKLEQSDGFAHHSFFSL